MNKYTILAAFPFMCQVAFAEQHFYSGFNLGVHSVEVNKTLTYPLQGSTSSVFGYHSAYDNFHAQLFLGNEFQLSNSWELALQTDFDFFVGRANNTIANWFFSTPAGANESLSYSAGLFLLPEYQLPSGFKIFAGPGIILGDFATSSSFTAGNIGVTGHYSNWLAGGAVKVGTINKINDHLDFLLSYQYDQFNHVTHSNIEPLSGSLVEGNYKPSANIFSVGVRYQPSYSSFAEK